MMDRITGQIAAFACASEPVELVRTDAGLTEDAPQGAARNLTMLRHDGRAHART